MKKTKNYISRTAAVENLRRLFSPSPNADQLSLQEIFIAAGRERENEQTNRNWLANKMTQLKYHNLIKPIYKYGQRKELVAIKLGLEGKKALGRLSEGRENPPLLNSALSADGPALEIAEAVRAFRDNYPEFDVVFEVRLKKI